jgi:SAM-dependent methyltransferase
MIRQWAQALGLAETSLFAPSEEVEGGEHKLLLDGIRGSFSVSQIDGADIQSDSRSWAWSSGVLHHVTATPNHVIVRRWDKSGHDRYPLAIVSERLDRFYDQIFEHEAEATRNIAAHAIDAFRRLRSTFDAEHQPDALSVFLLLLAAMIESIDVDVWDRSEEVMTQFDLPHHAPQALGQKTRDFAMHLIAGFRRPTMTQITTIETIPSLVVRHAGAIVFQEAHLELGRRGALDLWGVPDAATVSITPSSGVHFTPPGLARVIVEQALEAYGPLPAEISILDPACGSGSILHEAIRTLHDRGYDGRVRVIGYDESPTAVAMARFLISVARRDWPGLAIIETHIDCRDSLSECEWSKADLILMNPPFVSWRWLDSNQKKSIHDILGKFARGRPDLSMAFIEQGVRALAPNGVIGTLLPAGVLTMTYAQQWRRHLLDSASVYFLAVFSELSLFRLATVETGCVVLRKVPVDSAAFYKSLWVAEKRDATPAALRYLRRSSGTILGGNEGNLWTLAELPARQLVDSPNWRPKPAIVEPAIVDRYLGQVQSRVPTQVKHLFQVRQGALPAPREAFVIDALLWQQLPEAEHKWFRRVAENQNIRSGRVLPGKFIFYSRSPGLPSINNEAELQEHCPQFFNGHLRHFKPQLASRRGKTHRWWELGEDRKWLRIPNKKIISAYFGESGSFGYDRDGDHIVVQGYGWLPLWRENLEIGVSEDDIFFAYLVIFNSIFFTELLANFCPTVGGGQFNLSKRFSESVPLPDLTTRVEARAGSSPAFKNLSRIGEIISTDGLVGAPRSRAEEVVRFLYGL